MLVKILKNKLNKIDQNLKDLFNNFKNDKKFLFLFYLNFTIQIITLTILPISLSGDSFQYLAIAERINIFSPSQFFNTNLEDRSLGYPLFLYVSLTKTFMGITLVIFLQSLAAIFIPLIIYKTFKNYHENASFFVSIIFSVYIYKIYTSIQIMTEILFMLFISTLFLLFLKFINKKNLKQFIFLTLNVLVLSLIRPSGQLFFYLLLILLIIYFIKKETKFLENLKLLSILIIGLVIFKAQQTPAAKNMPYFMAWYEVSVAFCDIKDSHKINNISKSKNALVPDDRLYLIIKKDKKNFNKTDEIYQYKEKCLNFSTLNDEKKNYLATLSKLIDKDLITANTLKSTYDVKGSPDKIDPDLVNLNSVDLIKKIHEKYIFPLPFQHIFWRLSADIGRDKTTQLLNALSLRTIIDRPEFFFNRAKKVIKESTFSWDQTKNVITNLFFNISGIDMYFWRFVPSVYESIEEQNLTLLYKINPKIYLQHLYNLETLIGSDINKIYSKIKKPWEFAEKDFHKNNNPLNFLFKDKNIAKTATILFMILNYYTLILIKFLITFIFPFYIIFIFLRIIYKKILKKKKIISGLEITILFFSLFSYVSIFISLMLVFDPRHILMHFIGFVPLMILIMKNFSLKKK